MSKFLDIFGIRYYPRKMVRGNVVHAVYKNGSKYVAICGESGWVECARSDDYHTFEDKTSNDPVSCKRCLHVINNMHNGLHRITGKGSNE